MNNKLSLLVNFVGIDKMSGALKNIVGLGRKGSESLRGLTGEARKLSAEIKRYDRLIAQTTGNSTALWSKQKSLMQDLERVQGRIASQQRQMAGNAKTAAMMSRGADLRGAGTGNMVGGGAQLVAMGAALSGAVEFDAKMADIGIKLGTNEEKTGLLATQILTAAKYSQQLPSTMQTAADTLASVGAKAKDIPNMLGDIGKVATAYNALPADLAGASSAAVKNLGVASTDTGKALALMAVAGKAGKFEIRDMAAQFPMLAASAASLGQKGLGAVADLSAAAQFAAEGVGGDMSQAANNLNNLLAKINTEDVRKNFKDMGVDLPAAMKKAYAEGKTPLEAIAEITKKTLGGDLENLPSLFGDMQAQNALKQLVPKLDQYRALRADIQKRTGEVDADYARKAATSQAKLTSLLGSLQRIGITVGSTVLPSLVELAGYLERGTDAVAGFAQAHPTLIRYLILGAGALAGMRVGLGVTQYALGSIISVVGMTRTVFGQAKTVFLGLRTAALFLGRGFMQAGIMMMANPIVLLITAIVVAIGVAAYLIYTHWDKIKAAFWGGVAWVKQTIGGLPGWLKTIGSQMMQGLLMSINPMALAWKLIQVAKNGITAFKSFLGIKSPSRVFMALGQHTTEGLAIGINRGGKRPAGAMKRVAGLVAGAGAMSMSPAYGGGLPPPGGRPPAPPMSVTINVYGAPGQSAKELAREVKRELEQAAGVKARSSFDEGR